MTLSLGRGNPQRPTVHSPLPPAQVASVPSLAPEHVSPSTSALPSPEQVSSDPSELSPAQVSSPASVSVELSPEQLESLLLDELSPEQSESEEPPQSQESACTSTLSSGSG